MSKPARPTFIPINVAKKNGFTLLELMVALAIFAALSMAGWQIMNSLTKSRDRANIKVEQLGNLQYAYLQLSQDLSQVTNYVVVTQNASPNANDNQGLNAAPNALPSFKVTPQSIDFIRFANPDPRYSSSPALTKIGYGVTEGKLIQYRYHSVTDSNPTSSMLLDDIRDAKWTALTPDAVENFPDDKTLQQAATKVVKPTSSLAQTNRPATQLPNNASSTNLSPNADSANTTANKPIDLSAYQQLPKGVRLEFNYHDQPIVWIFALPAQTPN